jgi:hypothetical protein
MNTYILNKGEFSIVSVIDGLKEGKVPLCPVCKSPVHVASTAEEARRLGIPPGMQCSKVPRHFHVEFNLNSQK